MTKFKLFGLYILMIAGCFFFSAGSGCNDDGGGGGGGGEPTVSYCPAPYDFLVCPEGNCSVCPDTDGNGCGNLCPDGWELYLLSQDECKKCPNGTWQGGYIEIIDSEQCKFKNRCTCNDGSSFNFTDDNQVCCPGTDGGKAPDGDVKKCKEKPDECPNGCINGTCVDGQCICDNGETSTPGVCCPPPDNGPAPSGDLAQCDECDPHDPTACPGGKCVGGKCVCLDGSLPPGGDLTKCPPDDPWIPCEKDTDCPPNAFCDPETGLCTCKNGQLIEEGKWGCCPNPPYRPVDNISQCENIPCDDDSDCPENAYCDPITHQCVCDNSGDVVGKGQFCCTTAPYQAVSDLNDCNKPDVKCENGTLKNGACYCGNGQIANQGVCCPVWVGADKDIQGPAPKGDPSLCCKNGQTPWFDKDAGQTINDATPATGCCPLTILGKTSLYYRSPGPAAETCNNTDCGLDSEFCKDELGNCIEGPGCKQ